MGTPAQRTRRRHASLHLLLAGPVVLPVLLGCGLTRPPHPPAAEIAGIAASTDLGWASPPPPAPAAADRVPATSGRDQPITAPADGSPAPEPSGDPAVALIHRALVHLLLDDAAAVAADHAQALALDRERVGRGEPETDLADQVRYLGASLVPDRAGHLAALDAVREDDADPLLRRRIKWRIETDQVVAARRLLSDSRFNRGAKLVNDAVRPLGQVTSLALSTINPLLLASAVADSLESVVTNLRQWHRPSPQDREALSRLHLHLRGGGEAAPVRGTVRELRQRVAAADCARALRTAEETAAVDPEVARAQLRVAASIRDCSDRAVEALAELDEGAEAADAATDPGLWPLDPLPPIPRAAQADYEALLVALVQADAADIRRAAAALAARPPNEGLGDEAHYALSVAADLDGDHEQALRQARDLARNESTNMGRRAAIHLDDPEADRFATLREAVRQHRRQRLRYVLFGKRPSLPGTLRTAARTGLGGLQAAQTLGVFNVVGVLTRAIGAWRSDPIPNDAIVAAGEDFVAREPNSPNVSAVRRMLAAAYEREGQYERALFHIERAAEPDGGRIDDLTEKAAEQTRRMAETAPSPAQQRILFAMVRQQYPDTRAATKADEAIRRLSTDDDGAPTLPADVLRTDARLSDRLGVLPAWRDGQPANGEIGGAGLRLVSPDRALLTLDTPDGPVEQPIVLDEQRSATLGAALEEAAYREAAHGSQRHRGAAPLAHLIPFYLQGTVGESGIAVFPGIKPREHTTENRALYGE